MFFSARHRPSILTCERMASDESCPNGIAPAGQKAISPGQSDQKGASPWVWKVPRTGAPGGGKSKTRIHLLCSYRAHTMRFIYPGCRFALWLTLPWAGGLLPRWGVTLCMSNRPASKSPRLSPPWCITDLQIYNCLN